MVFQSHVGTQIKTEIENRVGGNWEIQHPRSTPAQDSQGRPGLVGKHHPSTTKDFYAADIWYCFQCYLGTSIQTHKEYRVGGAREIHHLRFPSAQDAQGRPGLACKEHPSTTKSFYGQLLHTVFQCHVGPIQTPKENRFGGNRAIQHTRFTPQQDAKRRPGLGCKHHPSTAKDFYATDMWYCFQCHLGTPIQGQKEYRVGRARQIQHSSSVLAPDAESTSGIGL